MLWALTSYFNPLRYRRRRENYKEFRRRLKVPLLAVELGYEGRFDLEPRDADILVQIAGRDVMWQKERLLNVGAARLPPECDAVASIDCDVFFSAPDWPGDALDALRACEIVQLFSQVHHLKPDSTSDATLSQPAATRVVADLGDPVAGLSGPLANEPGGPSLGFAWAYRRELLERHGLFDACIAGGGDRATLSAAYGLMDQAVRLHAMNPRQQRYYLGWARPFFDAVQARVGGLAGELFHLWHGRQADRGYERRHTDLQRFDFDPFDDIALDESGCWRWSSEKPQLHAYLRDYFASRREDD